MPADEEMNKKMLALPRLRFAPSWNPLTTRQACGLITLTFRLHELLGKGLVMSELGSRGGESASIFAASGLFDRIDLVDIWAEPHALKKCMVSTHRYPFVKFYHADLFDRVTQVPDQSLDFIYIDADHSYEPMVKMLPLWDAKLRAGGILGGHDYTEAAWPGVYQSVNEYRDRVGGVIEVFDDFSWLITGR